MSGTMEARMLAASRDPEQMMAALRAEMQARGVPITTENLNQAMLNVNALLRGSEPNNPIATNVDKMLAGERGPPNASRARRTAPASAPASPTQAAAPEGEQQSAAPQPGGTQVATAPATTATDAPTGSAAETATPATRTPEPPAPQRSETPTRRRGTISTGQRIDEDDPGGEVTARPATPQAAAPTGPETPSPIAQSIMDHTAQLPMLALGGGLVTGGMAAARMAGARVAPQAIRDMTYRAMNTARPGMEQRILQTMARNPQYQPTTQGVVNLRNPQVAQELGRIAQGQNPRALPTQAWERYSRDAARVPRR